jgi:hypothetical protein
VLASPGVEMSGSSEVEAFLQLLRAQGVVLVDGADVPTVAPRGHGGPEAVIEFPEDLLVAYLDRLGRGYAPFDDDPRATARGLLAVQLADELADDHGGGVNRIRRVALVDGDEGPQLVEECTDDPPPRPATGDAPHDDPAVFAAELEALAAFLRAQELDAVADPEGAAMRLSDERKAEPVTVALRPDLYRRWFETAEEEFEAIGGDPREHAWRLWCRTVAAALTRSPGPRLALAEAPDGEVLLRPEASGPALAWSAEPGT